MDIQKMDVKECKVLAYDLGRTFEITRQNLQVVNKRIQELECPPKKDEKTTKE